MQSKYKQLSADQLQEEINQKILLLMLIFTKMGIMGFFIYIVLKIYFILRP